MPVVYKCIKCGSIIFAFLRAGQDYYGIPSPSELIVRVGSKCPGCGRELERNVTLSNIDIKIVK